MSELHGNGDSVVCTSHGPLLEVMTKLCTNIEWLVRIGNWALIVLGAAIVICIPLFLGVLQDIQSLKNQMTIYSSKLDVVYSRIIDDKFAGQMQRLPK